MRLTHVPVPPKMFRALHSIITTMACPEWSAMRLVLRVPVLCGVLSASMTLAQTDSTRTASQILKQDGSDFLRLTGHGLTSPLRWNGHDLLHLSVVAAGTFAASTLDDEAFDVMSRNHTPGNNQLEKVFEAYGNGITAAILVGTLYSGGLAFENSWMRETGLMLGSALVVAAGSNVGLKYTFGRARPYTNLGNDVFRPFIFKSDYVSFPSGHTVVAFTVSSVLARRIGNVWASIALYTAATLGGASRLYSRNHWFSDDVFAAALAISVSHSIVSWYERGMREDDTASNVQIIPQGNGVTVVWTF